MVVQMYKLKLKVTVFVASDLAFYDEDVTFQH